MQTQLYDNKIVTIYLQLPEQVKEQVFNYMQFLISQYHLNLSDKSIDEKLTNRKQKPEFGCMKGLVKYMADDFDEPLSDFNE